MGRFAREATESPSQSTHPSSWPRGEGAGFTTQWTEPSIPKSKMWYSIHQQPQPLVRTTPNAAVPQPRNPPTSPPRPRSPRVRIPRVRTLGVRIPGVRIPHSTNHSPAQGPFNALSVRPRALYFGRCFLVPCFGATAVCVPLRFRFMDTGAALKIRLFLPSVEGRAPSGFVD